MASVDPDKAGLSAGARTILDFTVTECKTRCELRVNGNYAWLRFTYIPAGVNGNGFNGPIAFTLIDGRGNSYGSKGATNPTEWTTTWNPILIGEAYKVRYTYAGATYTTPLSTLAA
ncbi:MAG: hypothetical protein FWD75_03905 [Propionibacteriaceae bacterium]|nr:hypothetical protein [Propionibacteriaceae bacterium]